jgi:hypothetical protein
MTQRDQLERRLHRLRTDVVLGTRARARLVDGFAREHTEGDRDRQCRDRELGEGTCDGVGENIEVSGLASNQAAKRHDSVETARSRQGRDRRWQLERASDLELFDLRVFGEPSLNGAAGERASDLVVPACAHDRDARAACGILSPSRSLPSRGHLSQSSPRMQPHCRVTG